MNRVFASRRFWIALGVVFAAAWSYSAYDAYRSYESLGAHFFVGGLAALFTLATIVGLRAHDAYNAVPRKILAELDALGAWARDNGWTVQHLGHRGLTDELERIEFLTDNAGWGHGTTGSQRHGGTPDWGFGGAVARDTPAGRLIVIGGFRRHSRRLWAALKTNATAPRVTWDLVAGGRVEQSGPTPVLDEGEPIANVFVDLEPITRLRFIDNEIILCTPGRFEPALLTTIAERLTALERRLPRRPGAGPQR